MSNYTSHSKLIYTNYNKIQEAITHQLIDVNDIIICEDTKEMILIRDDFSLFPIKSKLYRYIDYESAETELNKNTDTYEGQLVAVLSDKGTYEAYIVNRNARGTFYITPLNAYSGSIDYDTLGHKPIINLYGKIEQPIIIDQQNDGIYAINGNYKISEQLETVFSSANNNLFIVSHMDDGTVKIKKISTDEIIDYTVSDGVSESIVPTTEWLQSQGYATEQYVNIKLEALDIVTRDELKSYVDEVIGNMIDEKIDEAINSKFKSTTENEIVDLFATH